MTRRKRFGVSVNEPSAKMLDALCSLLGVSRSRVVEEAIEEYLSRYQHLASRHHCIGVFIVAGPVEGCGSVDTARRVVAEFGEVVKAHLHMHESGYCVEVLMVSGDSSKIRTLYSRLKGSGRRVMFVPLHEVSRGTSS